jgi:hypothetical protein
MTIVILSTHSGRLIPLAHNLKTKHSKGEREMVNKKILNHKTVELNSFSVKHLFFKS